MILVLSLWESRDSVYLFCCLLFSLAIALWHGGHPLERTLRHVLRWMTHIGCFMLTLHERCTPFSVAGYVLFSTDTGGRRINEGLAWCFCRLFVPSASCRPSALLRISWDYLPKASIGRKSRHWRPTTGKHEFSTAVGSAEWPVDDNVDQRRNAMVRNDWDRQSAAE